MQRLGREVPLVLLVEDDEDHAALAAHALRASGVKHELVACADGLAALAYLEQRINGGQELPRLVLLDLQLPGLHGLEVLEQIRSNPASAYLPVVVMTSSDEDLDIDQAYALGNNSYVRKPVDYDRFRAMIDRLGRYWLQDNVPPRHPTG